MKPPLKPKFLFVCIGNSCRSQMAEGFAKSLAGDKIEAFSAGSRPCGYVNPGAIVVMKELGINITKHYSKGLTQIPQEKYEAVVTMGCGDACPQIPANKRQDWQIPDPQMMGPEEYRVIRDQIQEKVKLLLEESNILGKTPA